MYDSLKGIASTTNRILLIIIASWIIGHIFAVVGIFFALLYPVWWLIGRPRIQCIVCKLKKTTSCEFKHALYSSIIYLILAVLSMGLVYGELQLLKRLSTNPGKTVNFIIPNRSSHKVGEIFEMDIKLSGIETAINVVRADIYFNSENVEVVDISTSGSLANIFLEKQINNDIGYARLVGGIPNPGFAESEGFFAKVYLRGKKTGLVQISYLPSSLVLANDGEGTNVLAEFSSADFIIVPDDEGNVDSEGKAQLIIEDIKGVASDSGQMLFFNDDVLSATDYIEDIEIPQVGPVKEEEQIEVEETENIWQRFINFIVEVDHLIVSFWKKIMSSIVNFISFPFR